MLDKARYLERMEELAETIYDPERLGEWIALWNKATRKQQAYWNNLKDMDPAIFEATFNRLPAKFNRFPTIAEIMTTARNIAAKSMDVPTRELAWKEIRSACSISYKEKTSYRTALIRSFGTYDPADFEPDFDHPFIQEVMDRFGGCETLEVGALAHHKQRFDTLWMELLEEQLDAIIYPQRKRDYDSQIPHQLPSRQSA